MERILILHGDCRTILPTLDAGCADVCVTSPPYYWQRDYGFDAQIGHEPHPNEYISTLVAVFSDVRRVLKTDGLLWLNVGDAYYSGNGQPHGTDPRSSSRDWMRKKVRPLDVAGLGYPKKSALGLPWRLAHALQEDGWTIRSEIIWCRETAFPEPSVKDRPHRQHEQIFLLAKSRWYYFDRSALPEESVWHIGHERGRRQHSAAYPEELVRRCVAASTVAGQTVLDPFGGSGTTASVSQGMGRKFISIDASETFSNVSRDRVSQLTL